MRGERKRRGGGQAGGGGGVGGASRGPSERPVTTAPWRFRTN